MPTSSFNNLYTKFKEGIVGILLYIASLRRHIYYLYIAIVHGLLFDVSMPMQNSVMKGHATSHMPDQRIMPYMSHQNLHITSQLSIVLILLS